MKIICVARNYIKHAKELKNDIPKTPVIFCKPDSAILQNKKPFFIPSFSNDIHHEVELIIKINRVGKHIQAKYAHKYFNEISVGIDFTARDLQQKLKNKNLPWEKSKGFDNSAAIGGFKKISELKFKNEIKFSLQKNKKIIQQGNSKEMIFNIPKIIEHISEYFTLKIGDIIFTGTPAGVSKIAINDILEAYIENEKLLQINVR